MCLMRVFDPVLPRRLFVLITHTSGQVCGVCGGLSRLFMTQLAHGTDRKHGERKRGDSGGLFAWCVCIASPCRADCLYCSPISVSRCVVFVVCCVDFFLIQLALETDRKHGESKRLGDFWR